MKYILGLIIVICCFFTSSAQTFKVGYEVYQPNGLTYSDSIEVNSCSTCPINDMSYSHVNVDAANYIYLHPGDSLMMYLFYPMQAFRYYSVAKEKLYTYFPNHDIFSEGPEIIRDKFDDSLSGLDTICYQMWGYLGSFFLKVAFLDQTSLDDNNDMSKFVTYPNPSSDILHISLPPNLLNAQNNLVLFDSVGKEVSTLDLKENITKYELNVSSFPIGIYYLQCSGLLKKITILH